MDINRLRSDTPATDELIHLNNAGASLSPEPVLRRVIDHLMEEARLGGYEAATRVGDETSRFYESAASLIGADPQEIAFTDSATRGMNTLLYGLPLGKTDRIVTFDVEFGSTVVALQNIAETTGAELVVVPLRAEGPEFDLEPFTAQLDERTRLVVLTQIPAQSGLIAPAAKIAEMTKRLSPALFVLDACQSLGQMPVSIHEIQCDALVATGRKWLRGPRGTGFIFVRSQSVDQFAPPTVDLANTDWLPAEAPSSSRLSISTHAKRFEIWERSTAGMLGLGEAVRYASAIGALAIEARLGQLSARLRENLGSLGRLVRVFDPPGPLAATVTLCVEGQEATETKASLSDDGINVSVLHDWDGPWDFEARHLPPMLRVSPHYFNTQEEIDSFVGTLKSIAERP